MRIISISGVIPFSAQKSSLSCVSLMPPISEPAIDFLGLARGFGLPATEISEPGRIDDALRAALATPGPTLTAFSVDDGYGPD